MQRPNPRDPLLFEGYESYQHVKPEAERRLLRNFARAATERLSFPVSATVVGMPVNVVKLFDSGHPRRGLLCCCSRNGLRYTVDFLLPVFAEDSEAAALQATYQRWLKLPDAPPTTMLNREPAAERRLHAIEPSRLGFHGVASRHKHPADPTFDGEVQDFLTSLGPDQSATLVVTSCKATRLRCRTLDPSGPEVILYSQHHDFIPAELLTVQVTGARMRHRSLTLTGHVLQARLDVPALDLTPLALQPLESSAAGAPHARPAFALSQPLAGLPLADAIAKAYETHVRILPAWTPTATRKLPKQARYPLFDLLAQDLRCLDAYAYLGEFALDQGQATLAQRYFTAGAQVASLSLELAFDDLLPWDAAGNRGFLRCLRGQALSGQALHDRSAKRAALDRLRALDPSAIERWPDLFQ